MIDKQGPGAVRRAQPADVDAILDLLTEYERPRSYFEPFYRTDPSYRPEQSWLIEQDSRLAAHARLFDRQLRLHETTLRIAGVGNVITATAFRGQGHAGRLLQAMTAAAGERFGYSILWTHLPTLYARYGWVTIDQTTIYALVSHVESDGATIEPFRTEDLPKVIELYEASNQHRTGPLVRTSDYWRAQLAWLQTEPGEFLVARSPDGAVCGYVRSRITHSDVEILELSVPPDHHELGRALVARAARPRAHHVQAHLPPSLLDVIPDGERDIEDDSRFMGRLLDLGSLLETLTPVLRRRATSAGLDRATFCLATSTGSVEVRFAAGRFTLAQGALLDPRACVSEAEFAHLLFHGFDQLAAELLDGRPETAVLRTLFPAQDFVFWPADKF